jgi:AcrR family transcriptional regulator
VEKIATEAGLGKTTLLHYFQSKEALFNAVIKESIDHLARSAEVDTSGTPYQKASILMKQFLYLMIDEPYHARLLNRTFAENPRWARYAARRYWNPMVARFQGFFPDNREPGRDIRTLLLLIINAILQIAFSLELQIQLLGPEADRDRLLLLYENEINHLLYQHFSDS